jgi:hypothetical protein
MSDSISTFIPTANCVNTVNDKNINDFRKTPEGARIYKRTLSFLLSAAAYQLGLNTCAVEETIGASFLINCDEGTDASVVLGAMRDLIGEAADLTLKDVERTAAIEQFTKQKKPKTVKRVYHTPEVSVKCYSLHLKQLDSEFLCLQYGHLLPNVGLLDKDLIALESVSTNTLQLFYPQVDSLTGSFELNRTPEPMLMEAYAKQKIWAGKLDFQSVTDVNEAILHSKGNMVVQLSEAMHEFQIVNIATKVIVIKIYILLSAVIFS